jgi:hypothetical protein
MQEILLISLVLAVIAYWWDTTRANEVALNSCRRICQSAGVQLLDASISRQRVWLRRHPGAGVQICRLYSFEYSHDSENRQYGYIVLIGHVVVESRIGPENSAGSDSVTEPDSRLH